jgi:hypothetical protein
MVLMLGGQVGMHWLVAPDILLESYLNSKS